jgi:hypothetical protein
LLPDVLWNLIQPLLPSLPRRVKGGRPRQSERSQSRARDKRSLSGVPTAVAHDDEAATGASDSVGKCLSLPMHTDLVIRKSAVHFRDAVLGHVAGDTGGRLACAARDARMIGA